MNEAQHFTQTVNRTAMNREPRFRPEDEDQILLDLYGDIPARSLAKHMRRSVGFVYRRAAALGLSESRPNHGPEFDGFIRAKHELGWSDSEIADAWSDRIGRPVDRHTVSEHRRKFGLPSNALSEHRRQLVRQKTEEQLREAGVETLAELRAKVFRERARAAGWPEDLRPRAVQILNALWDKGPRTRRQLADDLGMPWKGSRKSLVSNDPEGSYLAHLVNRGLVVRLKRAKPVTGQGRGKSVDVYSLPLNIVRSEGESA